MKFSTYKNRVDIRQLLIYIEIIDIKELIIPVIIEPDYDVSEYKREIGTDYFIINKWSFRNYFEKLTNIEIISHRFYHNNDFKELDENLKSKLSTSSIEENLNIINEIDADFFGYFGSDSDDYEEFKLNHLRIRNVDNLKKNIQYEGAFFGDSYSLDILDFGECGFYSKIQIEGICQSILYKDLLGESYLLYLSGNYKLSHFVAYSAFENFLNLKTNSFSVQERLSDKLKKMFKESNIDTNKNTIYCSIINNFSKQTKRRNNVAHGKTEKIDATIVELFFIEIITMIILYEKECLNFEQLIEEINA